MKYLFLALAAVLLLFSCKKEAPVQPTHNSDIQGVWTGGYFHDDITDPMRVTFNIDGKGSMDLSRSDRSNPGATVTFDYAYDGKRLNISGNYVAQKYLDGYVTLKDTTYSTGLKSTIFTVYASQTINFIKH